MKQANTRRAAGRPRSFVEEEALRAAMTLFRRTGYDAATVDELAAAMSLNKPSVYRAFGDKKAIYEKAVGLFMNDVRLSFSRAFDNGKTLRSALEGLFATAVTFFSEEGHDKSGCLVTATMPAAAGVDEDIRNTLYLFLSEADEQIAEKLRLDHGSAFEGSDASVEAVAMAINATIYSIALRARSGAKQSQLAEVAMATMRLLEAAHLFR